jgi:hypothetical protein
VTFIKLLTIYHSWIHTLHHSPLSLFLHSWNSFTRFHFSTYIHVYRIFLLYPPSYNKVHLSTKFPTSEFSTNWEIFTPFQKWVLQILFLKYAYCLLQILLL